MRMIKQVHLSKPVKFLIVSILLSSGVVAFAWHYNINSKIVSTNKETIVSWLSSFKSQDFKTCDLLPQSKNYRLDNSVFTKDSSSVVYEKTLEFLAKNIQVQDVKPVGSNEFIVSVKVPICSTEKVDFKVLSDATSDKLKDSINLYISKKCSSSEFNDKNREILLNNLVSVLESSKTSDYTTISQRIKLDTDGTVYNTRNLVYKITVESKVNDVLQSYIENLNIYIDYEVKANK